MRGRVTNPASLFNARDHPRLGGGWRRPAVELPLPELSRCTPRRSRPDAVVGGRECGRGELGSSQRLARPAHAMRCPPRALAPWHAGFAHRLRGPHRRRNRPYARAPAAARECHAASRVRPRGVATLLGDEWPLYRVLSAYAGVEPRTLAEDRSIALADGAGTPLGISCSATAVARRPPRYARAAPPQAFDVGLRLTDVRTGGTLGYVPTAGAIDDAVRRVGSGADLLLFDGTFWSDDELTAAGVDAPTAREMGHLPVGGAGGSLELLPRLDAKRVVLVHINNTNPILCRSSAERARVEAAGIVVGEDAMEFEL